MQPADIALVQSTFERVEELELEASGIFYEELFVAAPHLRPLFPTDMDKQYRMFIMAVAYCVGSLHQLDAIRGNLEKLAVRHVDYGALPEHYEIVGGALMRMLARVLGNDFTPEAKVGWSQAYQNISSVMLDAAAQHTIWVRKAG